MPKAERTYHFITRDIDGVRARYFGEWDDEQFHSLPYIKDRGHVPPGWHAHHISEGEIKERRGPRFEYLLSLPMIHGGFYADIVYGYASVREALQRASREG